MGELHAKSNGEYTVMLVNIEKGNDKAGAESFGTKNSVGDILHFFGQAPASLGLRYIPHKTLISTSGKILQNGTWNLSSAEEYLKKAIEDGKASEATEAEPAKEAEAEKEPAGTDL